MKRLYLLLYIFLLITSANAQTTSWSSSPTVTPQTRKFFGANQIRWLYGSNGIYSIADSLVKYSLKAYVDSLNTAIYSHSHTYNGNNTYSGSQTFNNINSSTIGSVNINTSAHLVTGAELSIMANGSNHVNDWHLGRLAGTSGIQAEEQTIVLNNANGNTDSSWFFRFNNASNIGKWSIGKGNLGTTYYSLDERDKGIANGLATLDGGGKIPIAQLPANLLQYKDQWNPNTNTPMLSDGTGTLGWVYEASVDGNINLGSGTLTLKQGDFVIYNGTKWTPSTGTDRVTSVNGQQGIVSLTTSDIAEGSNLYFTNSRGDARYGQLAANNTWSGNQLFNSGLITLSSGALSNRISSAEMKLSNSTTGIYAALNTELVFGNASSSISIYASDISGSPKAVNVQNKTGTLADLDDISSIGDVRYLPINNPTYTGILTGSATTGNVIKLGSTTDVGTTTPLNIDMGASNSSVAGSNPKILLYNSGGTKMGIGISNALSAYNLDYIVPSGVGHSFWVGGTKVLSLNASGAVFSANVTAPNIPTILTTTSTISFTAIASGSNASSAGITLTGAAVGDVVMIGLPATIPTTNVSYSARVTAANTIVLRCDNNSTLGAVTPGSATYTFKIIK